MGHFPGFEEAKRQANARRAVWKSSGRASPRQETSAQGVGAGLVFDGPSETDTELIPPDPQIAAGPTYIVVAVNSLLAIYDKKGNLQGSYQSFSSFFEGLGITGQIFDPRIIYDQADQRFLFSAGEIDFTNLTNGHVFLAVSASSDPTGIWHKYAIDSIGRNLANNLNTFPDFPGLGLSSSAVYLTTNQFMLTQSCIETDAEECYFSDAWIRVIGLPELLTGNPDLNITTFKDLRTATGFPAFAIQPAVSYGTSGAEFMVAVEFSSYSPSTLNLFSVTTSGTPALTTADLTVPVFNLPPYAVQYGSSNGIDTDDFRPLSAVWVNGSLWFTQNVGQDSYPGVLSQWYQVQISSLASAALTQFGSVIGSGDAFYPAILVKADGTVGLAFTTSSEYEYASAAFTARAPGDPSGTTRGYAIYRMGYGPYDEPVGNRWGDYSGLSVDPSGDSFWMFAEYAKTPDPDFGTAVAQVGGPPELSISPALLDFKQVLVGQASSPQNVTVTNNGSNSLTLGTIALTGANTTDFVIASNACSGTSLAPNQTCSVPLTFKPSMNNDEYALLSVPYAGNNIITIGVTGFGLVEAVLNVSPAQLAFPATVQQSASAPQVVTLSNLGNAPAILYAPGFGGGADFAQTNNCPSTLTAGASCQYMVTFRPTFGGFQQGWLGISSPQVSAGPQVALTGTGVTAPVAGFCPGSLTFASQTVLTTSASQPVIFTNTGSSALFVSRISAAGDFSETDNCVGSLPPRASCTISVSFTPTAAVTRIGSITVIDNALGAPHTISLTGAGTASAADLMPVPHVIPAKQDPPLGQGYGRRELEFERNDGQFDPNVEFVAHTATGSIAITKTGITTGRFRMTADNASPNARISGSDELPAKANYFIGNDPRRWRTNVPVYARAKVAGLYPGIDLVYYGNQRQLEYDFLVAPHADPRAVRLRFDGQSALWIDGSGDLIVTAREGNVRFHKPSVYQSTPNRTRVDGQYVLLAPNEVGFKVACYAKSRPLIIDPVLTISTYLAGSASETAGGIAVDSVGNAYVTGTTSSLDFPITNGAFQNACGASANPCDASVGGSAAFISKLSAAGALVYSTYLGGTAGTQASAIGVDTSGNAYITGTTTATDFPVTLAAFQNQCKIGGGRCASAFVTKLNAAGSALVYSTYLGGTGGTDEGLGIAVDSSGNAYVGGLAQSLDFPATPGAFQTNAAPNNGHGFVAKLNPVGSALVYSTYLGGTSADQVNGIAVDAGGNAYVTGRTNSLDFPTTNAFQVGPYSQLQAFITKLGPSGSVAYSTYLGGTGGVEASAIAIDSAGAVYVTGSSALGHGFPLTPGALISTDNGGGFFVTKLHPAGCALLYSTFVPVTGTIALNSSRDAYVAGSISPAPGLAPLVHNLQPPMASAPGYSPFLIELDPNGASLLFSSYLGGTARGYGTNTISGIALDGSGDVLVAGTTNAPDFPIVNAFERTCASCENHGSGVFVAKISPGASAGVTLTRPSLTFAPQPVGYSGGAEVQSVGLTNNLTVPLGISSISVSGAGFALASPLERLPFPCTGSIAPGAGCVVQVQYLASQTGPQTGTLKIADNGSGSPRTVTLNGQGLPDFALAGSGSPGFIPKGTGSAQFTIYAATVPGLPPPSGKIELTCSNVAPATCSFSPPSIDYVGNGQSTLTVSGLISVAGYSLNFSVAGTLSGQSYTLPLSIAFQSPLSSIVSAADYAPVLAPESIAAAFGSSLGPSIMGAASLPLPTTLNGTTVEVTGSDGVTHASPLFYVSASQVNFELPAGTAIGPAVIAITSGNGAVSSGTVNISAVAPTLFSANADGKGPPAGFAVYANPDGSQTSDLLASYDPSAQKQVAAPINLGPAKEQVYLTLFGTGIRGRSALANVSAAIGAVAVPVTYAGAQGGYVGLDQINLGPLPRSLIGAGTVNISITMDGQTANLLQIEIQ